jgi:hypothetical protein
VQLLDVGLVEIDLGDGASDLGVREHAGQLALRHKALDLFEFLQFGYGHCIRFHVVRGLVSARVLIWAVGQLVFWANTSPSLDLKL